MYSTDVADLWVQYYHEHIAKRMPNFKRPTRPDDWSFDQVMHWCTVCVRVFSLRLLSGPDHAGIELMVGCPMMRFFAWQWLEWAESTHDTRHTNATHVYMRLSDQPLLDDLTLFLPEQPSLIVKDPRKHMGIHCRFGVKRTIVDAHFDTARNMVAQVGL
jgi:hypothetical protein